MKLILLAIFIIGYSSIYSQNDSFILKGNVEFISNSNNIIVNTTRGQRLSAAVKENGSFILTDTIKEAGIAMIKTDSSYTGLIWLEPGFYSLNCKEIKSKNYYEFRIPEFHGPQ